jgi:hypothetical protein
MQSGNLLGKERAVFPPTSTTTTMMMVVVVD